MAEKISGMFVDRMLNIVYSMQVFAAGAVCQKQGERLPAYKETCRTGPDHCPHFTVRVSIADGRVFEGSGASLPDARQNAAMRALDTI